MITTLQSPPMWGTLVKKIMPVFKDMVHPHRLGELAHCIVNKFYLHQFSQTLVNNGSRAYPIEHLSREESCDATLSVFGARANQSHE
ncbi:MAG TPA: hypothetical protein ENI67_06260 [Gammaproteobacteria bacterium]|nr:hypothetical protein [Gammaproteobacteria bacterium]